MTLADVLAAVAGLAIAGLGFASISAILSALFPLAVDRARVRLERHTGRSIAIGLLLLLALIVGIGGLLKSPVALAHLTAAAALLSGLSLGVLGGAGLATSVGRRCGGSAQGPLGIRDLLRGAALLEGAALLPLVGWFVVLPVALLASLGAGLDAFLRRDVHGVEAINAAQS